MQQEATRVHTACVIGDHHPSHFLGHGQLPQPQIVDQSLCIWRGTQHLQALDGPKHRGRHSQPFLGSNTPTLLLALQILGQVSTHSGANYRTVSHSERTTGF